ncbi:MAG: Xaa-Pro dipeptidase [Pseudomonadota bacterium]
MDAISYQQHLAVLDRRWSEALAFAGFDAAVVAAGAPREFFLDDQGPPFRANPHLLQWLPEPDCAHAALLIRPGARPRLFFHQPRDFWHAPPEVPEWAGDHMDVEVHHDLATLDAAVAGAMSGYNRMAFVGETPPDNLGSAEHNPPLLLNHLHFHRAYKTPFEVACMVTANHRAAAGHCAARAAFEAGASEFDIHLRYLGAARQPPEELPYPSIVARDRHAGVLHYQHYDRTAPEPRRSFLIDAGASAHGYAADVTRTYAGDAPGAGAFAELVTAMDAAQRNLVDAVRPGLDYVRLHELAHEEVARILSEQGLIRTSPDSALETGLTRSFLPHGVGHLIGLQTHDVGGQQVNPEGGLRPAPAEHPALRLTRSIEPDQVFTVEPGLYFIPMLLDEVAAGPLAGLVDWARVDAMRPFGGIRIEDNVLVTESGVRNLTREAFAQHG